MSVTEAAEKYFVCDRTIRNWIKAGKLEAVMITDHLDRKRGRFFKKWKVKPIQ